MKFKIKPIAGDASFRKFYRLISNKKSKILVFAEKEKYKNLIAYSAVNQFLRANHILAPKLYESNLKNNFIVIEDFGNNSFYKILNKKKNKIKIYKQLVDLLLKIQKIKPKSKLSSILGKPYKISKYNIKHLHQESDLFFEWYLPLLLKKKISQKIKIKAKKILSLIYKKLNYPNSCFVHKDYHAQNLMKVGKKIAVIDTQDTLIGNPAYDLVSLIDDVRIKNSNKIKNQIFSYYLKKSSKINKRNYSKFLEDFNILSVQRSLKIIGIFSRLFIRDKKKRYLKFIPYTWKILEMRMNSQIFLELKKIFDANLPKNLRNKKFIK